MPRHSGMMDRYAGTIPAAVCPSSFFNVAEVVV